MIDVPHKYMYGAHYWYCDVIPAIIKLFDLYPVTRILAIMVRD